MVAQGCMGFSQLYFSTRHAQDEELASMPSFEAVGVRTHPLDGRHQASSPTRADAGALRLIFRFGLCFVTFPQGGCFLIAPCAPGWPVRTFYGTLFSQRQPLGDFSLAPSSISPSLILPLSVSLSLVCHARTDAQTRSRKEEEEERRYRRKRGRAGRKQR